MRVWFLAAFAALYVFGSVPAQAKHHHHVQAMQQTQQWGWSAPQAAQAKPARHHQRSHAYADGRPGAWCGWFMRHEVGTDPGTAYNLARNWAHWGHAASGPAPGVIGVMPHHVFKVIQVLGRDRHGNQTVLAISGNDGHAVRTRPRSTSSVIAWRTG